MSLPDELCAGQSIAARFMPLMQRAVWDSAERRDLEGGILVGADMAQRSRTCMTMRWMPREIRGSGSERRMIGGSVVATVSIPKMYRLLRQRAAANGDVLDNWNIHNTAADDEREVES